MKNLLKIILSAVLIAIFNSCNSDPCDGLGCGYGTCVEGICECESGAVLNADGVCVDPCEGMSCGQGACVDGVCICDAGYEKDTNGRCSILMKSKFLGNWTVTENCSLSGTRNYAATVESAAYGIINVSIGNFWGTYVNQVAAHVNLNDIRIVRQEPDNDNFFVNGNGIINASADSIFWTFTITDENAFPALIDECTATWVK